MVKFKTPEEMEARRAFINGADKDGIIQQQESMLLFSDLKKLKNDELLDRLEQVDNQATLIRWRILWELRQRFKSDKLFGQYIAELKATRAICAGSTQDINRALHAGRFCAQHRITNLNSVGLLQSAVYALSRPVNEPIADEVYQKIKNKNMPVKEVERFIEQAKAVLTIDESVEIDSNHSLTEATIEQINLEPETTELYIPVNKQVIDENIQSSHQQRMDIFSTLPPLDNETSKDDILEEVKLILSFYERTELLQVNS